MTEHFDVVIVGAGLSGIGAAVHLQRGCPDKSFAILEARAATGGTWDLFRYPGIRSDSDMHTLGYAFKPWTGKKAIVDGPDILAYIRETARENDVERHIRCLHKVKHVAWSTEQARWRLTIERPTGENGGVETVTMTASFLWSCSGYYDYDDGYTPDFPGLERFAGEIVHPQKWHEGIAYADKRIVVIGSGATAMTLIPQLAKRAAHVTMLQRSPTYVFSRPAKDFINDKLREWLPEATAYSLTRWKNVLLGMLLYEVSQRRPELVRQWLIGRVKRELGEAYAEEHFTPDYGPWDQRLCVIPDDDLFHAIRDGRASVVTASIDTFTERGIRLSDGRELEADMIVTATGLVLRFAGGMTMSKDGRDVQPSELVNYRGSMFSDVPNFATTAGYTNASWTLKADLTADFIVRILRVMDRRGAAIVTPRLRDPNMPRKPLINLMSGYVKRAADWLPKQGTRTPWRMHQNYILDTLMIRYGSLDDGELELSERPKVPLAAADSPQQHPA